MADREKVLKGLECCIYGYGCDSCESCPYYGKYAGHCVSKGLMPDVLELLKKKPEQKHGHWIMSCKFLTDFQCSVCQKTYIRDCQTFNFCPNCGAIMDEKVVERRCK